MPHKDEPRGLAGGAGFEAQGKADGSILGDAEHDRKRAATAIALLALQAHVVHRLSDGGYLVTWRGLTRECRDLAELEAHARRVGALR